MFDYSIAIVIILAALAVAGCKIRNWVRKAPLRKAKAERNWFISTLVDLVEAQTATATQQGVGGYGCRKKGKFYWSVSVDLGLAVPGSSTWQMRYAEGDTKPDGMTDEDWRKLVELVKKFGRADGNGSFLVWVDHRHSQPEYSIMPYESKLAA